MSKLPTQARSRYKNEGIRENLLESKELEFLFHKIFVIFCQVLYFWSSWCLSAIECSTKYN